MNPVGTEMPGSATKQSKPIQKPNTQLFHASSTYFRMWLNHTFAVHVLHAFAVSVTEVYLEKDEWWETGSSKPC
jgi:hypothetical protein